MLSASLQRVECADGGRVSKRRRSPAVAAGTAHGR